MQKAYILEQHLQSGLFVKGEIMSVTERIKTLKVTYNKC